jgi:Abortive infection C-terminus
MILIGNCDVSLLKSIKRPYSDMSERKIPNPVIAVVADVLGSLYYSHTRLNTLFSEAGAPDDPPEGNCINKCDRWLKRCNEDPTVDALVVLGRVLENFMELRQAPAPWDEAPQKEHPGQRRICEILSRYGFSYQTGGMIFGSGTGPATKSLNDLLRAKDLPGVEKEFQRALSSVESDPPAGVTAACSLLESLFKVYLEDNGLPFPGKQTISDLFKAVRAHLGIDPSHVAEEDLRRILSGLISIADGIGSLRTHAGSAHGHGRKSYCLEPRQFS